MIRYPSGYCCQDDKTCKGIDSCNKHRTGPLCGKWEGNWTESLFSSQCIPVKNCSTTDIIVLYIFCAIAHALGLMELNYAKDVGSSVLKKLLGAIDRMIPCRRGKQNFPIDAHKLKAENASKRVCSSKRKTKKSLRYGKESITQNIAKGSHVNHGKQVQEDDNAMKYVQILFYYIQDSTLFKVQLPSEGQQDESIVVKILQFCPEVLIFFYTRF